MDPPTQAEIAKRAHELYLPRGGTHGYDLDDWLQAERELKAEIGQLPEEDPAGPEKPLTTQGGRAKVQSARRQKRVGRKLNNRVGSDMMVTAMNMWFREGCLS